MFFSFLLKLLFQWVFLVFITNIFFNNKHCFSTLKLFYYLKLNKLSIYIIFLQIVDAFQYKIIQKIWNMSFSTNFNFSNKRYFFSCSCPKIPQTLSNIFQQYFLSKIFYLVSKKKLLIYVLKLYLLFVCYKYYEKYCFLRTFKSVNFFLPYTC